MQAVSPDGEAIVTGAGDETLRFCSVFSKARSQKVTTIYFRVAFAIEHEVWIG
jgi:WD40 repeat protein